MNPFIRIYNGYQIKPYPASPSCSIVVTDGKGGKVPNVLAGLFTSPTVAMQAIDDYLGTKEMKDDQKVSKRGV
jgi:hypothetical protein